MDMTFDIWSGRSADSSDHKENFIVMVRAGRGPPRDTDGEVKYTLIAVNVREDDKDRITGAISTARQAQPTVSESA